MNTRLEIASRAMAGMLADHTSVEDTKIISRSALAFADALIQMEAETRPPTTDKDEPDMGTLDEAIQSLHR